jgi:ATP-binding cassette subfamily B protein
MTDYTLHDEDHVGRFDPKLWRRVISHARPYRGTLVGLALSGVTLAATDVLLPYTTGRVIDEATTNGVGTTLWLYCGLYLVLVTLLAALILVFIHLAGRTATGLAHDVRKKAFAHLQRLSFSFYDRRPVGWLMARLTSDSERLSEIIPWFLLDAIWGTSLVIGISIAMLLLNWQLGLLVMCVIPPLFVASAIFQRRLLLTQREVRRTNSQITAGFNEGIMGTRTTKALVREEENLSEFQKLTTSMYTHSMRNAILAAVYLPLVITLGSAGVGLALWKGGIDVVMGMSLGTLIAFMQYAALFYIPIQELAERLTQLQAAQAAAERVQGLLDTEPEIADSFAVRSRVAAVAAGRRHGGEEGEPPLAADGYPDAIGTITFDGVTFAYKEGEPVLREFDLEVGEGETIALVGATGSGKSTIVSLVSRFYEPTEGRILIDGVDYRERSLEWLQSNLGIVLQSPHLFSGSIADNIRYGRLDATDEEVRAAARLVNADDFVSALPEGYATDVGEGGARLSTGEKQLISLARAVLADPRIFVMDEATSSVDTETERLIQTGIERVLDGRISFVIAHRLSTIRRADRILVIDRGRIVEEGTHETLIALGGHYHALYTNQFARERAEQVLEGTAPREVG